MKRAKKPKLPLEVLRLLNDVEDRMRCREVQEGQLFVQMGQLRDRVKRLEHDAAVAEDYQREQNELK